MAPLILGEHLLGAYPSSRDPRDYQLAPRLDTTATLPSKFRLRLLAPPLNQGNTGRCVAFAGTGLRQQQERSGGHWSTGWPPLDAEWLYEHAEAVDGIPAAPGPQRGTTVRAALRVLARQGQPLTGHPASASRFRIASYWAVPFAVDAIKRALVQWGPIWVAGRWYAPWFYPVGGVLPRASRRTIGGHARFVFGWDDSVAGGAFLVRNSWGRRWGVQGNSYDPYGPFVDALHDAWSTTDVKGDAA